MSGLVIGAVLLGALLHASWNALVKAGGDRWLTPALFAIIAVGVMSLAWERGILAGGHGKAVFYAVLTGIAIAGYSLLVAAGAAGLHLAT
jgi:hypothetical protein